MGRYHLRCKNRFLYYYVSVCLLRVEDNYVLQVVLTFFILFYYLFCS